MNINSNTYLIVVKVIHRVEVSEESITNEEKVLIFTWQSAFMNNKEAFIIVGRVKILLGVNLENVVTHLESNWLDLICDGLARLRHPAESGVTFTIEVGESLGPLLPDILENIWRN